MKFRPLHDRVLIKVLDSEEKTAGGIIIPDTAKEKPQEGEVVAVGPGLKNDNGKVALLTGTIRIVHSSTVHVCPSLACTYWRSPV